MYVPTHPSGERDADQRRQLNTTKGGVEGHLSQELRIRTQAVLQPGLSFPCTVANGDRHSNSEANRSWQPCQAVAKRFLCPFLFKNRIFAKWPGPQLALITPPPWAISRENCYDSQIPMPEVHLGAKFSTHILSGYRN